MPGAVVKGRGVSRPTPSYCSLLLGGFLSGMKAVLGEGGSLWEVSLKLWMYEFLSSVGKQNLLTW